MSADKKSPWESRLKSDSQSWIMPSKIPKMTIRKEGRSTDVDFGFIESDDESIVGKSTVGEPWPNKNQTIYEHGPFTSKTPRPSVTINDVPFLRRDSKATDEIRKSKRASTMINDFFSTMISGRKSHSSSVSPPTEKTVTRSRDGFGEDQKSLKSQKSHGTPTVCNTSIVTQQQTLLSDLPPVKSEGDLDLKIFKMKRRPPPQRKVVKKATEYYVTKSNKVRRVYTNRCERYCMGPISIVVDAIGFFVLAVVNMMLVILSMSAVILGIIVKLRVPPYRRYLKKFVTRFQRSVEHLGLQDTADVDSVHTYLSSMVFPIMIVGSVMGLFAIIGQIGACTCNQPLLNVYAKLCSLLLLVQFCVFVYIYDGKPYIWKYELLLSLDDYRGMEATNKVSKAWNQVMSFFDCCGVDGYQDFQHRRHWPPTEIWNETYDLITPVFCCKNKTQDFTCALEGFANKTNNNMHNGCYDTIYDLLFRNDYTMGFFLILFVCQGIVLFFSSWLHWSAGIQITDTVILKKMKDENEQRRRYTSLIKEIQEIKEIPEKELSSHSASV